MTPFRSRKEQRAAFAKKLHPIARKSKQRLPRKPWAPKPGMEVGNQRWPHQHAHPDGWEQPRKGIVLAQDDPRAWADGASFPARIPTREETAARIARLKQLKAWNDDVPVLWDFGKIYWESPASLRSYDEDVAKWHSARRAAYRERKPEEA